ncbi:MAG: CHAD domain-containing protein [Anaerolineales bacterium]|nr:CHAD domain-containing protein [Anaerolineales bacterium]
MSSNRVETEAKFNIPDAATFAALQQLDQLGDFQLKPVGVKTVVDSYLDTADRRLFQAGLACRLRNIQDRCLITLKALTPATGTIHRRQEIEATIKSADFEGDKPHTWGKNEAQKRVVEIAGPAPLQTLFTLHQIRYQFHAMRQDQPVIEFSLDAVSLSDPEVVDFFELEGELIGSGSEADLARFVSAVQSHWPVQPQTQSKFERAWEATPWPDQLFSLSSGQLSAEEGRVLAQLANSANELWAKRALIILMSESRQLSVEEIAGEVGLAARTVRRWQREFTKKRLEIFPAQAVTGRPPAANQPMPVLAQPAPQVTAPTEDEVEIVRPSGDKIGLESDDSLAEAGRKVLAYHFARMLKHEPGTRRGEDIEALHDMRVATRRMRAAFRVFEQGYSKKTIKPLLAGLRATGRALGRVRDLDVFMETLQAYQLTLPPTEQSGLQPLLETWSVERTAARREMLAYLDSPEYSKFKQNFRKFVKTKGLGAKPVPVGMPLPYQLRHVVPSLIYKRYEAVHAFEVVLETASIETLHELRIAFKQLRYTLENFEEILGQEREMVIREVKILQDHLGQLNDAHVASELLRDFLVKWDEGQAGQALTARQSPVNLVAYLNTRLSERQRLIVSFPVAWARFNQPEFRRNLALAVSVL